MIWSCWKTQCMCLCAKYGHINSVYLGNHLKIQNIFWNLQILDVFNKMFFKWTYIFKGHFQTLSCNTTRTEADQRTWVSGARLFNSIPMSSSTPRLCSFPFCGTFLPKHFVFQDCGCGEERCSSSASSSVLRMCLFASLPVSIVNGVFLV